MYRPPPPSLPQRFMMQSAQPDDGSWYYRRNPGPFGPAAFDGPSRSPMIPWNFSSGQPGLYHPVVHPHSAHMTNSSASPVHLASSSALSSSASSNAISPVTYALAQPSPVRFAPQSNGSSFGIPPLHHYAPSHQLHHGLHPQHYTMEQVHLSPQFQQRESGEAYSSSSLSSGEDAAGGSVRMWKRSRLSLSNMTGAESSSSATTASLALRDEPVQPYAPRPRVELNLVALRSFIDRLDSEPSLSSRYFPSSVSAVLPEARPGYSTEEMARTVLTQAQLALEFGLITSESAIAQFRFRDFKRNILDRAEPDQIELFSSNPAHGIVTQRLPHKMSRRAFAFRLLLAVFHVTLKTGHIPLFWRSMNLTLAYHMLPASAALYLPEIALMVFERAEKCSLATRIANAQQVYAASMADPSQPNNS